MCFYALGKLYLTEEKGDVQRAVSYFEQCWIRMRGQVTGWEKSIYLAVAMLRKIEKKRWNTLLFLLNKATDMRKISSITWNSISPKC